MNLRKAALIPAALVVVVGLTLPAAAHDFGDGPLDKVQAQSNSYAGDCNGEATPTKLKARALSISWNEATNTASQVPSPMTLSRWDTYQASALWWEGSQPGVNNDHRRLYWNPGIGIWQLDDAGMGAHLADARFGAERSVKEAMDHIRSQLCNDKNPYQWSFGGWVWYGCQNGECLDDYQQIFNGNNNPLSHFDGSFNVHNYGGSEMHDCYIPRPNLPKETWECLYVKPGQAEGWTGWSDDPKGEDNPYPRPLANPFYVFRDLNGNGDPVETRYWMKQDTPLNHSAMVRRQIPDNSRSGLNWFNSPYELCDDDLNRCSEG